MLTAERNCMTALGGAGGWGGWSVVVVVVRLFMACN